MFVIRFFAGQLIYYLFRKIQTKHCLKSVQKRSFFWSVFSLFGLNTEIYEVNLFIPSEYGKIGP